MNVSLFDLLLLFNTSFLIGVSTVTLVQYSLNARIIHIGLVAGSDILKTLLITAAIIWHVFVSKYRNVAIGLALLSFAMTDYAVIWILGHSKQKRKN